MSAAMENEHEHDHDHTHTTDGAENVHWRYTKMPEHSTKNGVLIYYCFPRLSLPEVR
jgi:hypothetical protein